ncbi:MAG: SCO family protein [Phycisphaerae bacterium]
MGWFAAVGGCSRDADARDGASGTFLSAADGRRIPDFSLIERSGRRVSLDDLAGRVWVADFVFTTCRGPCPQLSLRMRSLNQALRKLGDSVKTVSFSVDPLHDTPPILRVYAEHYGADADSWWFLTGKDETAMHELITAGFLQALSPSRGGSPIIHSTRFVLVDRKGRIRGWYDGMAAASKASILRDVKRLLSEPRG